MSLPAHCFDGGKFKKSTNEPGMSLKIKDGCGKLGRKPGMSLKTKDLALHCGNVIENTGG
jgi:hypothetical protein